MKSLQARLVVAATTGIAAVLLLAFFLLFDSIERRLRDEFDLRLEERARALAGITEQEGKRLWLEFEPRIHPEFLAGSAAEYFEIRDETGTTVALSESLNGRSLVLGSLPPEHGELRFDDLVLPDGRRGRAIVLAFSPRLEAAGDESGLAGRAVAGQVDQPRRVVTSIDGSPMHAAVLLARESESLERYLAQVWWGLLGGGALLWVALAAVILWTVRSGLAPVRDLSARLQTLDAESLGQPLGAFALPAELLPVERRLTDLLSRLHRSFERERQFSVHVAHELRTPLAELRSGVDVALRWPDDRAELVRALEEARSIGAQMERLVANLLRLAREEAGVEPSRREPVALAAAVDAALGDNARALSDRRIEVRNRVGAECSIAASPAALELALQNLASNSAAHAPAGSWLEVRYAPEEGIVRWLNPASGLRGDQLEQLFERFWRRDSARSVGEHSGLGLTLVRVLARRWGGDARAKLEGGCLVIELSGLDSWRDATQA